MILNARSLLAILSLMMTPLLPRRNLSMKFRLILSSQRLLLAQQSVTREYPSLLAHLILKYSFHCQFIHLMVSWWAGLPSLQLFLLEELVLPMIQFIAPMMNLSRLQGCAFMGVHYIIMQWQNSVLLLGESTVLKLQVKKLRTHVELKISMMELTTLVHHGSAANEKHGNQPIADVKLGHLASGIDSSSAVQITETHLADLLDCTPWKSETCPII